MRSRTLFSLVTPLMAVLLAGVVVTPVATADPVPTTTPGAITVSAASLEAEQQLAASPRRAVRWETCDEFTVLYSRGTGGGDRLQCARIRVPLDYDRPTGRTISLRLTRMRASGRSTGSVFVNLGGPGAPAGDFVASDGGRAISPRVSRHLDVIGIDPRGTGYSAPVTCQTRGAGGYGNYFPVSPRQEERQLRADAKRRAQCRRDDSPAVNHATTADNARDLELVRRSLGLSELNFYGVSWGSYLGATYAALFPGRIRTMVVDGVIDPVAWAGTPETAGTPYQLRMGVHTTSYEALTSALAECDRVGPTLCRLAGGALAKWTQVITAARDSDRPFDLPAGYGVLVSAMQTNLSDPGNLPFFLKIIAHLQRELSPAPTVAARTEAPAPVDSRTERWVVRQLRVLARRAQDRKRAPTYPTDVVFDATICGDALNPQDPAAYPAIADQADAVAPGVGRLWAWASSPCAAGGIGSSDDAFRGPWATTTSGPLLVIGNTHDPVTSINGARVVNSLFTGSRLLTYDGWGHGALGRTRCLKDAAEAYLVQGVLPAEGAVCAGRTLFSASRRR